MAVKKKGAVKKKTPTTKKRSAGKKAPARKKVSAKKSESTRKLTSIRGRAWTQAQLAKHLAEEFDIPQSTAKAILAELATVGQRHLAKGGVGVFTVPGICRLRVTTRRATKARVGRNPRTGEEVMIPARKAGKALRARPVKALKDIVTSS